MRIFTKLKNLKLKKSDSGMRLYSEASHFSDILTTVLHIKTTIARKK